ncbi:response regulator, partial [Streptomyces sp. NPDC057757]|uniref:response regulator n=1 Tax=Streptomyces sp. NPDC057757 TaxID=3346241 RepID=UPI003688CA04
LEVLVEAADCHAALSQRAALQRDVVLMDIRMPHMDGVEATARLTATPSPPSVLILTTYDLDEYVFGALQAGASGFLLKDASRDRLLEAIRVIHAGEALLSPSITRRLIENYASRPRAQRPSTTPPANLTPRERETLVLIAKGLSNPEIAAHLVVTEATVKSHIGSVFAKLHLRDRAQAVIYAYENGHIHPGHAG